MRIAHVCRVAPPSVGGMETVLASMVREQRRQGDDVRVVTLKPWGAGLEGEVVALDWRGPAFWPIVRGLGRALVGVDLVHVHGIDGLADQVLTLRPQGCAVGVSTHGGFFHTARHRALKRLWFHTLTRLSLSRADAIWFDSRSDQALMGGVLQRGVLRENGVDLRAMRIVRERRSPERDRWVVMGRVDHHKGLDDAVRCVGAACARGQAVTLDVIGGFADAALEAQLRERSVACGVRDRVVWHGRVDDAARDAILARAELALFPSHHEGFGLALIETMAAGVPVLVRPIAAHAEHVRDRVDGLLVDFGKPDVVLAAVAELRADPARAMRLTASASERAERWSWERVGSAWREAYKALCETAS